MGPHPSVPSALGPGASNPTARPRPRTPLLVPLRSPRRGCPAPTPPGPRRGRAATAPPRGLRERRAAGRTRLLLYHGSRPIAERRGAVSPQPIGCRLRQSSAAGGPRLTPAEGAKGAGKRAAGCVSPPGGRRSALPLPPSHPEGGPPGGRSLTSPGRETTATQV